MRVVLSLICWFWKLVRRYWQDLCICGIGNFSWYLLLFKLDGCVGRRIIGEQKVLKSLRNSSRNIIFSIEGLSCRRRWIVDVPFEWILPDEYLIWCRSNTFLCLLVSNLRRALLSDRFSLLDEPLEMGNLFELLVIIVSELSIMLRGRALFCFRLGLSKIYITCINFIKSLNFLDVGTSFEIRLLCHRLFFLSVRFLIVRRVNIIFYLGRIRLHTMTQNTLRR